MASNSETNTARYGANNSKNVTPSNDSSFQYEMRRFCVEDLDELLMHTMRLNGVP